MFFLVLESKGRKYTNRRHRHNPVCSRRPPQNLTTEKKILFLSQQFSFSRFNVASLTIEGDGKLAVCTEMWVYFKAQVVLRYATMASLAELTLNCSCPCCGCDRHHSLTCCQPFLLMYKDFRQQEVHSHFTVDGVSTCLSEEKEYPHIQKVT